MFKKAKRGDKVWHITKGWQNITSIDYNSSYPIIIGYYTFTFEGKSETKDLSPSIFWDEIKFKIPPKPLPKLEVDTKVLVWDNDAPQHKFKRHFSHFDKDGQIMVFASGATSWSTDNNIWSYNNWELYEETKDKK